MRCGISSGQKKTSEEFTPPFIVEQGTPLPGVIGGRDADTFRRLFDKVRHLSDCQYYTDNWEAFAKVLPVEHHHVGNAGTATVERNNSYTRHHLGWLKRRTKIVLKTRNGRPCHQVVDCFNRT